MLERPPEYAAPPVLSAPPVELPAIGWLIPPVAITPPVAEPPLPMGAPPVVVVPPVAVAFAPLSEPEQPNTPTSASRTILRPATPRVDPNQQDFIAIPQAHCAHPRDYPRQIDTPARY